MSPTEQRYSTYDRELLAIFAAVRHFRYQLEGRQFVICTDHKPLQFAFTNTQKNASPRIVRQLDFMGQFCTDIRHVPGSHNVPADVLSRIDAFTTPVMINYEEMAKAREVDPELKELFAYDKPCLQLSQVPITGTAVTLYCDVSNSRKRPYVPSNFRRTVFDTIHRLSHPGPRASAKAIESRFVWPKMRKDIVEWAKTCLLPKSQSWTSH